MAHNIYLIKSEGSFNKSTSRQLTKVGSSKNVFARIKNYKTYYHYPAVLIGYFIIHDFNCYKLDNIIKIQFNAFRANLGGGTEFYYDITKKNLEKLFETFGIKSQWVDETNAQPQNEITDDDILDDVKHILELQKKEKGEYFDFEKINFLICPVPLPNSKSAKQMYQNYIDTIVNGVDGLDTTKYNITAKSSGKFLVWGNGIKSKKQWQRMKVNDIIFITVSFDKKIEIMKVIEKIESNELSQHIWKDDAFPYIFLLDRIQTVDSKNIANFLNKYCGYNLTGNQNMQGNVILEKKKQLEHMDKLVDLIIE